MTLRLAFMGTPDFAVPTLAALIGAGHEIACVYSRAPQPKGRGYELEKSPVHKAAEIKGLMVRTPRSLRNEESHAEFAALDLDAAVVVAYGLILPRPILDAPRRGCFNLHASLLPRWRGAAPIQRAIMAGDAETGVMVMRMEEGLDTGPVLSAARTKVARKTFAQLHDELSALGAPLMVEALRGGMKETPQPDIGVTYARKIDKAEAHIDWTRSARDIDCLVRGLSPFPGAWFEAKDERIKLLLAEPVSGRGEPGEVLDETTIACADGALRLITLQRAGRAPMDAATFARGFPLPKGEILGAGQA
jgi:methionyl-tRNA formyltransferase